MANRFSVGGGGSSVRRRLEFDEATSVWSHVRWIARPPVTIRYRTRVSHWGGQVVIGAAENATRGDIAMCTLSRRGKPGHF